MSNDVSVNPTPIQRNRRDVAIEMLQLYLKYWSFTAEEITEDKFCELYSKFYKRALDCDNGKY